MSGNLSEKIVGQGPLVINADGHTISRFECKDKGDTLGLDVFFLV